MLKLTDIHCHILPGVDDGARNIREAEAMLKMQYKDGVRRIVATPHYRVGMFEPDMNTVYHQYTVLQKMAADMGIELILGCEFHSNLDMVETLQQGRRPTMGGSPFVLVEFSGRDTYDKIRRQIRELVNHGYEPIIAHVERYGYLIKDFENIEDLIELGAYLQVNASSVLGEYGWTTKRFCRKLMKEDCLHFVATDAHRKRERRPNLGECADYIEKKMGRDYMKRILVQNPKMLFR